MNNRNLSPARRPGNHGLQPESQDQAQPGFQDVLTFIRQSRFRALQAVNTELVRLYWRIGEHLSHRVRAEAWGQKTIEALAAWIRIQEPASRGFSAQNLWRMRQFFETYQGDEFLSPLVRELSWSHNMTIINKCNSREERAFYLKLAVRERWGRRELERQLDGGLFERAVLDKPKLSAAMKEVHPLAEGIFKDRYLIITSAAQVLSVQPPGCGCRRAFPGGCSGHARQPAGHERTSKAPFDWGWDRWQSQRQFDRS